MLCCPRNSTEVTKVTAVPKIVEPNMYKPKKKIDIITLKLYLAHFLTD